MFWQGKGGARLLWMMRRSRKKQHISLIKIFVLIPCNFFYFKKCVPLFYSDRGSDIADRGEL